MTSPTTSLSERLDAARGGAAVGPVLAPGLLRLRGRDRVEFLHRMSTQAVRGLAPGAVTHAAFLDARGHVLGDAVVAVREAELLLELEPSAAAGLAPHLRKYVIADDVAVEDLSAGLRVVPVLGEAGVARAGVRAPAVDAWRNPRRGAPALDLLVPSAEAEALRAALAAEGLTPVGADDLEVLRVLAGIPRHGADVDEARLPMEAALVESAVSFDKGCYLGQEIVLRGTFRGQVQRGLVQLALPADARPGLPLAAGDREVGTVTSAVDAPEGRVGLGYLRRAHWREGERVRAGSGEAVVRRVLVRERDG